MVVHGKYHPYYRLLNYFHLKSKLHDEQLDREGSIISYVSLVKTIETGIVLLLRMALHSFFFSSPRLHSICFTKRCNVFVCKPVALYHKTLFCRILFRN